MKCSKEIADKVREFEKHKTEAEKLYEEIRTYFEEELGAEGFEIPFITSKPTGHKQNGDEYCEQHECGEDWFRGNYYHQIKGSKEYVGYSFDI